MRAGCYCVPGRPACEPNKTGMETSCVTLVSLGVTVLLNLISTFKSI
uniref:Uncharacterized protein n=1 Tax=Arundo donax TaxID=35708 RepID=A0A0A8ZUW5_ARUDO